VDPLSEQRAAANEALSREVNEAIERGQWPGEQDAVKSYRCECSQPACSQLVKLTPREYERIRSHARRFIVAAGHARPELETVLEQAPGYLVVEKRGAAGEVAEETDPRA
jgi:hypothetical protein